MRDGIHVSSLTTECGFMVHEKLWNSAHILTFSRMSSTVSSQYSKTRCSLRFRLNTSIRFMRFGLFSCCIITQIGTNRIINNALGSPFDPRHEHVCVSYSISRIDVLRTSSSEHSLQDSPLAFWSLAKQSFWSEDRLLSPRTSLRLPVDLFLCFDTWRRLRMILHRFWTTFHTSPYDWGSICGMNRLSWRQERGNKWTWIREVVQ